MAFCSNCGNKLNEGAKFCDKCGNNVENSSYRKNQREIVFDGVVHKCPRCGWVLNSFLAVCPNPDCGLEIRSLNPNSAVSILARKLEELEMTRSQPEKMGFFRKRLEASVNKTDEQKINLIKTFPIPNTKEDVLEFCLLASSSVDFESYSIENGNERYSSKMVSEAWLSKFDHARKKAKILFNKDEYARIEEMYKETKRKISKYKHKTLKIFCIVFLAEISFILLIIALTGGFKNENKNEELKDNPNAIVINYSDEDLSSMQYEDAIELLKKQGFANFKTYEKVLDVDYYEIGQVASISIDADDNFRKGDYFLPEDLVVIYYYVNSDQ